MTQRSRLEEISGDWDRLVLAGRRPEVFQSFAWARAAIRTLDPAESIAAAVVRGDGGLRGILPLVHRGRTLSFLAGDGADYNDLLARSEDAAAVLESALEAVLSSRSPVWNLCRLRNVPADGNLAFALEELPPHLRARMVRVAASPCPTILFEDVREAQVRALANKESLRRHHARLSRGGTLVFRHLGDRTEIRAHLPALFRQHAQRRALSGEISQYLDPRQRMFFDALVDELDPASTLRFGVLERSGRPIAYHFGFQAHGKFLWYKPTFDVSLWDEGPGEALLRDLLLYCAGADVREFDFTVGAESFKYRFANHVRQNWTLQFHRSPRSGRFKSWRVGAREMASRRAPAVLEVARGLGRAGAAVRRRLRERSPHDVASALAQRARAVIAERDEVLVFRMTRQGRARTSSPDPAQLDVELRSGTLADWADLAIVHPKEFTPRRGRSARDRLKRGDEFIVAGLDGRIVHSAWVGRRDFLDLSFELGPGRTVPIDAPAPVIFDCWTAPAVRGRGVYSRVLRLLADRALGEFTEVFVYALASNAPSVRGIEAAGFALYRRLGRTRLLGAIERRWER